MKNPITKLRLSQFQTLIDELKTFQNPKNYREETLLIKNFEICYELIVKTLTSLYLSYENNPLPLKKSLFLWAFKFKLIHNIDKWIKINKLRNETVHEYLADEIYVHIDQIKQILPQFFLFFETLKKLYDKQ